MTGISGWLAFIFGLIAVMWVFQLYLTYQQAMRFNDTLKPLRQHGRTAVGLGGRRYRGGRAFVALAHQGDDVVDARVMTGLTVFAKPIPAPELIGLSLTQLAGDEPIPGLKDKVRSAARMAAKTLLGYSPTEVAE
jgi:DNA-binding transcriptional regulator of glucitol operon